MLTIPIQPDPGQTLNVNLANQPCLINIYQLTTGLFIDLYVNGSAIITGVICLEATRIVRDLYLGFTGDLVFFDTQPSQIYGPQDPEYTGLGARWILNYLELTDLDGVG